ncbi:MAG TPA: sulfatase-like hydrolase/transferase, partial [Pirellulales bacterium]|nr:sulfatase-like hydrolase/transferase [Pirellulales bacterium]
MKLSLPLCALALWGCARFTGELDAAEQAKRTNVVMIVVDDLCCHLGCYGAQVKSPHIDRLAAKGVRFDRAYCQYPVCNPSRTSFLTSLRPDTTGIVENQTPFRRNLPDAVTLPQLFREHGYFTAGLGKIIHQGVDDAGRPTARLDAKSWDDCRDFKDTPPGSRGEGRNLTGGKVQILNWMATEGTDLDQSDGQLAAAAIEVLEDSREKPFFLAVGFH